VAHVSIPFTADHPFLAYIYDEETKSILFMIKKID
jgi:serine protease inhibitor